MKVQMGNATTDLHAVQGCSKMVFPIGGHSVGSDKADKPHQIALQKRMPNLHRDRMRKGVGTNSHLKKIRWKTVEVKTAGSSTEKLRFCDQTAQLSIILPSGIAERDGWPAQQILKPVFTPSNFVPCVISSEPWKWRMAQCVSTHVEGRG
jgi:hypothetical protein